MASTSTIATQCLGYTPIPVALLASDEVPAVDLYRKDHESGRLRLYRAADVPMQPQDLERLEKMKVRWLYAAEVDQASLQIFIRRQLEDLVNDESVGLRDRFRKLNEVVREILTSAFDGNDTDDLVRTATYTADLAVRLLCQDELTAGDLVSLMFHDYQTVTHSLNVSYMMVSLARQMAIVPDEEMIALAASGILHDIGKLSISERILHKTSRLQRREMRIAQKHPALGLRRLGHRVDFSFAQLMVVYQHHERRDGSGYPVGAMGNEIHPWARVCSVVNVFESLISNRPYRPRYSLADAFSLMDGPLAAGLDQEMYQCWKQLILKK